LLTISRLYIDQPIGVGFSQGAPDILDEVGLAEQFLGFYKNFAHIFDVQSSKIYLTGESYAGTYLPYIGAAILAATDTSSLNLGGVMLYDPVIGDPGLQIEGENRCFHVSVLNYVR
jgi:carboxypeptidase D